jgi:hypothetical protein
MEWKPLTTPGWIGALDGQGNFLVLEERSPKTKKKCLRGGGWTEI